ncbi:MAG: DUF3696 domain-containing protein [Paludibacter sp.]|nr:DUF3696 domain-containing protein [Paludibacter sp.]
MSDLRIINFKCFEDISIPVNQLTVLAGANGYGKSTAIQSILFLRHTIESDFKLHENFYMTGNAETNTEVSLNSGYLLSLGNSAHIINRNSNSNDIGIGIFTLYNEIKAEYEANNLESDLYLKVKSIKADERREPIVKKEFYYLNAERIGPRFSQNLQYFDFPNAGFQGEYVAQLISERSGYLPVDKERLFKDTANPGLEFQVNEWLNFIMPGVRISAKRSNETFTAQIQIENTYTKGEPITATNIGFGISYVLPIIATGLIAKKDSYFIVENPEAHLHPAAQTNIGFFLGMVANNGVKVVVETHSDHVINGIQIAVASKVIKSDKVTINFFSESRSKSQPNVKSINLKENGELTEWPKGFFDQTQIDYAQLINLRRG